MNVKLALKAVGNRISRIISGGAHRSRINRRHLLDISDCKIGGLLLLEGWSLIIRTGTIVQCDVNDLIRDPIVKQRYATGYI
ncbi:hypothetical protein [Lacticaseibacillus sp. 866-1]|uniref:hypothetical protein n=1 Tax=Lacticaseibacillus sp. 866-1 TaxID=2799576 RepID=UPI0019442596|nr:hypothetical protein [Lacticaseibacillus sp. 866-1]